MNCTLYFMQHCRQLRLCGKDCQTKLIGGIWHLFLCEVSNEIPPLHSNYPESPRINRSFTDSLAVLYYCCGVCSLLSEFTLHCTSTVHQYCTPVLYSILPVHCLLHTVCTVRLGARLTTGAYGKLSS